MGKGKSSGGFLVIPNTQPRLYAAPRCPSPAGPVHTAGEVVAHLPRRHQRFPPAPTAETLEGSSEQEMGKGVSKTQRVWRRFEMQLILLPQWMGRHSGQRDAPNSSDLQRCVSAVTGVWLSSGPCSQAVRGKQMSGNQ